MPYFVIIIVSIIMLLSIWQYLNIQYRQTTYQLHVSMELFYTLVIIYASVIIGFGIIYFTLSFHKEMLTETGHIYPAPVVATLLRSMYFSGVTMLTIGYGDIVPLGIARFIAIVQALIGYLLPTTFVLKLVQLNIEKEIKRNKKQ